MPDDRPYKLYQWRIVQELGGQTCRYARGPLVAEFARYSELVANAEHLASAAGYPKSRWNELFDWSRD